MSSLTRRLVITGLLVLLVAAAVVIARGVGYSRAEGLALAIAANGGPTPDGLTERRLYKGLGQPRPGQVDARRVTSEMGFVPSRNDALARLNPLLIEVWFSLHNRAKPSAPVRYIRLSLRLSLSGWELYGFEVPDSSPFL
jgi:hypothetical protein